MTHYLSNAAIDLPSTGGEGELGRDSQHSRSPSTLVHLLDDDSLLIMFSFCRPMISYESVTRTCRVVVGEKWSREQRWWHRLMQVCRRWRYLVLDSVLHLQVSLVCARGTPVADMLAHSPPSVPLIIDHFDDEYQDLTAEEEKGIILALQHRDRLRRIRIMKPTPILQKLIIALDGVFPILEFLLIWHQPAGPNMRLILPMTNLDLPETFRAPLLRQLSLTNFATPIKPPQLTTMGNLVTLFLAKIPFSAYFHPNALLQRFSTMPRLERLFIDFNLSRDVERQLLRTPIRTRVTLPKLRWLMFKGTSAYLEALLPGVTIPLLEKLEVYFFNRMVYSIPHLRQFMNIAQNLLFKTATVTFQKNHLWVTMLPRYDWRAELSLNMTLGGKHLDWQVVSAAQVFSALKTVFSGVEELTFKYERHNMSPAWNRQADHTHWRELLGSFGKVKSLRVDFGLVPQVSYALQLNEGEPSTELFPELQKLSYSRSGVLPAIALFIDSRRKAGRPLTVRYLDRVPRSSSAAAISKDNAE